ncbi:hypothetical protein Q4F19_19240 [Sphingomonas sp. BIUV-7]|uniref:Uncharacterized protein n=1 Tax=Sphingomonas natans TaxID=3063330 RepID=A0ABT8YDR6_9SPHN|nr:hypothetical protein [Sphingomonas sp. BIUV-7]MDO6416526.1 hypothetical protein [Sphingomonas sp. BIUV-7]
MGAAAVAEGKLVQLEGNASRLQGLRDSLSGQAGVTSGAALGHSRELAMRLDDVRHGLNRAIGSAREVVELRSQERIGAHIARESAERLQVRAVANMHKMIEERMAAAFRPRRKEAEND